MAPFGGRGASGTGTRFGGGGTGANIDAFIETQWVTMQGDVAAYPFQRRGVRGAAVRGAPRASS
ncbi:hypothetical protein [Nonomuraea sp. NPDC049480]|uniref:hypothetical protein n=1 Tax=Nonomuraea sp. NPDC049480 TaxID=3364353 RepID=UPI003799A1A1